MTGFFRGWRDHFLSFFAGRSFTPLHGLPSLSLILKELVRLFIKITSPVLAEPLNYWQVYILSNVFAGNVSLLRHASFTAFVKMVKKRGCHSCSQATYKRLFVTIFTKMRMTCDRQVLDVVNANGFHSRMLDMDRVKRIWYLSPMRAANVQASLRIRAVSPEPSLLAHTSSQSRGTFRQKARSLAPLNGRACAVEICHDGIFEDTNSLDGAQYITSYCM